jgi:hypothetical protein
MISANSLGGEWYTPHFNSMSSVEAARIDLLVEGMVDKHICVRSLSKESFLAISTSCIGYLSEFDRWISGSPGESSERPRQQRWILRRRL